MASEPLENEGIDSSDHATPPPAPGPKHATVSDESEEPLTVQQRSRSEIFSDQGKQGSSPIPFEDNATDSSDRVFPIRSVVSVDRPPPSSPFRSPSDYFGQSPTNAHASPLPAPSHAGHADHGPSRPAEGPAHLHRSPSAHTSDLPSPRSAQDEPRHADTLAELIHSDQAPKDGPISLVDNAPHEAQAGGGSGGAATTTTAADDFGGLVTARFRHVMTEDGHAVVTGRDGEGIQRCEDEPIHIPGAVQSFGAMLALREESDGKLAVRIASENSARLLGYTPNELFALESFTDLLSEEQADNLLDHLDFVKDSGTDVEANGPEVFTMTIQDPHGKTLKLWCAIHVCVSNASVILCEFELEDDDLYPLAPPQNEPHGPPEEVLHGQPTEDDIRESTEVQSRPLRMLRSARKRKGEAAALEVFNIMSQVQDQLAQAANLDHFLKILVGVVKELTGFHRVMVYQFDHEYNGKVVTELVDPRATKDLYKGLHFPASDIPKQARDLYKVNKVRLLYDREQETARLVCRAIEDLETPLDMTHAYLRAMSPIHIKYLRNMAVRSSMSISINAFNELWGLVSCHAYGKRGTRVSFPIRKMCRLVGDSASRNIERLSYASRLQARKLINTNPTSTNPSGYIIASSEDLLSLFDADSGLLSIHGETKILGKLQASQEALALLEYLRLRRFTSVIASHDLRFDFRDLRYPPGFTGIAGLLLVPLSVSGDDFIVFFRKGLLKEVRWAGNPYEKIIKEGTSGFLEPRTSFKSWTETVVGKCKEWTEEELETAGVLCLVYGKFIEVWRQKQAAMHNTELTKLLLQNSAHEVRTPLNAIINYLEVALEGTLDSETRENLSKSHSASKSLIYVINDLLDLTKTEPSERLLHDEAFSPSQSFHEAVDMFAAEARRKGILFDIVEDPELPTRVIGDPRRVRQAISNITANAVEATSKGGIKVEMGVSARYESSIDIQVVVSDSGRGLSAKKLDDLFAELEQVQSENTSFPDEPAESRSRAITSGEGGTNKRTLGLGLAVVARIVRNMNGQLRLKSQEGKGSRFAVVFPCELPQSEMRRIPSKATIVSVAPSPTDALGDEVTLIERAPAVTGTGLSRRRSTRLLRTDSAGSLQSMRSVNSARSNSTGGSAKSQVDAMLEAMTAPPTMERSVSRDSITRLRGGRLGTRGSGESRPASSDTKWQEPPHLRNTSAASHGAVEISDSMSPLRAIRMPSELGSTSSKPAHAHAPPSGQSLPSSPPDVKRPSADGLNVLVAEDDPINSRIIEKRLQKVGHRTFLTGNGEECWIQFSSKSGFYDIVLMDMQMPIVDGMASTKMIRSFEQKNASHALSSRASLNGRIPIFAVSASLVEKQMPQYVEAGFDGWILKPVSFDRLKVLMQGMVDEDERASNVYKPGRWESGGWFQLRSDGHRAPLETATEAGVAAATQTTEQETPANTGSSADQVPIAREDFAEKD